jgi:hypothetical protein
MTGCKADCLFTAQMAVGSVVFMPTPKYFNKKM